MHTSKSYELVNTLAEGVKESHQFCVQRGLKWIIKAHIEAYTNIFESTS